MPVEPHDHRPAPTHPRASCRLFFLRRPPPCYTPPPPYECPLPPSPSQALSPPATHPRIPPSRPSLAQPSPALLPCPAPAFRPPSPPPLTDRPEKGHHLVSPFRASKNPAHCHPSHPSSSAAVPSSPSLSSRTALLSSPPSLLLSCLFLVGPLPHPWPSETSSRIPSRRAQAPGLWRLLFPGSPNQPLGRQRHAHNTTNTATLHTAATNEQLAHRPSLQTTCKYIASLQRGRRVASPRPTRHPAASMSAVRATALRAGGACVRCRKGKTKCVYENGRAPCKNCSKGMHECYLPSESMSHGGHGVSPARAARARETLPSERASGAATGDRHGSAHPTTVASRNSAPATEKYVCLSALSACAFFLLVAFPVHLSSCHPRGGRVCHAYPAGLHPLRRIRRRRRLCHDRLRKLWDLPQLSSARVLSVVLVLIESHDAHTKSHKSHPSILHSYSPLSAIFTTSVVVQGIRDDASYRGGLVHPSLLRLAPTSISFPSLPCCHCARRARRVAASSGTQHPILEPAPILGGHSSDT